MYKYRSVASRLVLACAAFAFVPCALVPSPAGAADLGNYRDRGGYKDYGEPIVVPQLFTWTGLYVGAHLGYGWGSSSSFNIPDSGNGDAFDGPIDGFDTTPTGWLAGLTVGYNYQMDAIVVGVEADLGYLGAESSEDNALGFQDVEYGGYATLTARLGYTEDRWLFYVKGGLAFADITTEAGAFTGGSIDPSDYTLQNEIETGWALGVGVEHAIQPNISIKAEYLYMDFGEDRSGNFDGDTFGHEHDVHTLKIGFNYNLQGTLEPLR
jgi:outer membrane immunogenic protein